MYHLELIDILMREDNKLYELHWVHFLEDIYFVSGIKSMLKLTRDENQCLGSPLFDEMS